MARWLVCTVRKGDDVVKFHDSEVKEPKIVVASTVEASGRVKRFHRHFREQWRSTTCTIGSTTL